MKSLFPLITLLWLLASLMYHVARPAPVVRFDVPIDTQTTFNPHVPWTDSWCQHEFGGDRINGVYNHLTR